MSECVLHGHLPAKAAGIGTYEGEEFTVCTRCGATLDSKGKPMTQELVEANRAISAAFHRATHP